MQTNKNSLVKHKLDYLKLILKISKLRYHGKEPPIDLLIEANKIGSLAEIPVDELTNLLLDLKTQ